MKYSSPNPLDKYLTHVVYLIGMGPPALNGFFVFYRLNVWYVFYSRNTT